MFIEIKIIIIYQSTESHRPVNFICKKSSSIFIQSKFLLPLLKWKTLFILIKTIGFVKTCFSPSSLLKPHNLMWEENRGSPPFSLSFPPSFPSLYLSSFCPNLFPISHLSFFILSCPLYFSLMGLHDYCFRRYCLLQLLIENDISGSWAVGLSSGGRKAIGSNP